MKLQGQTDKKIIHTGHKLLTKIPDHSYETLIPGNSGSGNTNTLLNLINHQPDTD